MPDFDPAMLSLFLVAAVVVPALASAFVLHRLLRAPRPRRRRRVANARRVLRTGSLRTRRRTADRLDAAIAVAEPRRALAPASAAVPSPAREAEFRHALVVLMFDALECWERTGGTRITLAERSGIWHVTCDDGRLRVRSMERYLTPARLPKQPRWRDVLRSAHYVLTHAPLPDADRARLAAIEEKVRLLARRRAFDARAADDA